MKQSQTILSAPPSSAVPSSEDVSLDEHVDLIDGPEVETRELLIPSDMHGERLDRALALLLPEFSRSFSQQLLSEGCVSCVHPMARIMTKASAKVRMAMAAMGQPGTNIGELCRELGVTRQTLYRHVGPDGSIRQQGQRLLDGKRH